VLPETGDVVWQSVLTLVLMNPKKGKKGGGGSSSSKPAAAAAATEPQPTELLDTWSLPENTGW
jgi:hypothetical protein